MYTETATTGVTGELLVRSGVPVGGTENRLDRLVDAGVFAGIEITRVACEIGLSSTACRSVPGPWVRNRIAAGRAWAGAAGVRLAPFVSTREVREPVTGEVYTAMRPPAVMLIEETDGGIIQVTPHTREGEPTTVADRLTELETRSTLTDGPDSAVVEG